MRAGDRSTSFTQIENYLLACYLLGDSSHGLEKQHPPKYFANIKEKKKVMDGHLNI